MNSDIAVNLANVGALPKVHTSQLESLAEPWFNRTAETPEEFFVLLGELYGERLLIWRFS